MEHYIGLNCFRQAGCQKPSSRHCSLQTSFVEPQRLVNTASFGFEQVRPYFASAEHFRLADNFIKAGFGNCFTMLLLLVLACLAAKRVL
jgi:hypothetical protein